MMFFIFLSSIFVQVSVKKEQYSSDVHYFWLSDVHTEDSQYSLDECLLYILLFMSQSFSYFYYNVSKIVNGALISLVMSLDDYKLCSIMYTTELVLWLWWWCQAYIAPYIGDNSSQSFSLISCDEHSDWLRVKNCADKPLIWKICIHVLAAWFALQLIYQTIQMLRCTQAYQKDTNVRIIIKARKKLAMELTP